MMIRIKYICVILGVLLLAGCGRPKTIGGSELKQIFKEAFLVNAYYDTQRGVRLDSLDTYGPILARHGYQVRDLEHTISNFARKKSASLSRVVEQAIEELKEESAYYDGRLAVIDTMYGRAVRLLRREVFYTDSIVVNKIADTAKLHIVMPAEEGIYEISYTYMVDTLDKNRSLSMIFALLDSTGKRNHDETEYVAQRGVRRNPRARILTADSTAAELELILGNYPEKELKTPHIRVDSLRVVYSLPRQQALDSVAQRWTNIWKYDRKTDSSAFRPLPPWADTLAVGGNR